MCYVRNKICFNGKNCIPNKIENTFIELLIPKPKLMTVAIIYKPSDQLRFPETLSDKHTKYCKRRIVYTMGLEY